MENIDPAPLTPVKIDASLVDNTIAPGGDFNLTITQTKVTTTDIDPTESYACSTVSDSMMAALSDADRASCIQLLAEHGLAIISSYSFSVLESFTDSVLTQPAFQAHEIRMLKFDGKSREKNVTHGWSFSQFVDTYFVGRSHKIVIVSTDSTSEFTDFMNEFKGPSFHNTCEDYKRRLKEQNNLLLVQLSSNQEYIDFFKNKARLPGNIFLQVPYLKGLLFQHLPSLERDTLYQQLQEQSDKGLWGSSEPAIYQRIDIELQKSKYAFFAEITRRQEILQKPGGFEELVRERNEAYEPEKNIFEQEALSIYLVYLAVFFEGLSVSEFRELTRSFLSDPKKFYHRDGKTLEKAPLLERWEQSPDHFFNKVRLKAFYSEDKDTEIITFEDPELRGRFRDYLVMHEPHFCQLQFEYLFTSGLLIQKELSNRVLDSFYGFVRYFGRREPERYVTKLLWDTTGWLVWINEQEKQENQQAFTENIRSGEASIDHLIKLHGARAFEQFVTESHQFSRLAALVDELAKDRKLKPYVDKYLDHLIKEELHQAAIQLLDRINSLEIQEWCSWIKELLQKAEIDIKFDVYDILVKKVANSSSTHVDIYLGILRGWIDGDKELKSFPARFGLMFIVDLTIRSLNRLPYKDYGKLPFQLQLLKPATTIDSFREIMERWFKWILNEDLPMVFTKQHRQAKPNTPGDYNFEQDSICSCIEEVYFTIVGLEAEEENLERKAYGKTFLELFVETLPAKKASSYLGYFTRHRSEYARMCEPSPRLKKEDKKLWTSKYRLIRDLHASLKNYKEKNATL